MDNNFVQLMPSEQELVVMEYLVLKQGKRLEDFARLIGFLGLRDVLNNLWALDQLTESNLLMEENSCGDFFTLKAEKKIDFK